ncbi:MAG: hypothetical protein MUF56_00390 [Solirubrobacteraceae bacterium]|nr:hypothetical protein [Solirubrobacteraceae bacterium]
MVRGPIVRFRLPACLLALSAVLALPAAAPAAELHAAPAGGEGPACTSAATPCSLRAALLAARASAGEDVIRLAAGTYAQPVSAVGEADSGVTLSGAGSGATVIAAATTDAPMVELGSGGGTMALEDLTLDATGAGPQAPALRARLAALALRRVRVVQTGAKQAPAIDADAGGLALTLDAVEVLADTQTTDSAVGALNAGGPLTIRDSAITHTALGDSAAVYARGATTIERSTLTHGSATPAPAGYPLRLVNTADAVLASVDSSVLGGGLSGARFDLGVAASRIAVRGATIAPGAGSTGYAVDARSNVAGSTATATVDSSLLLERSVRQGNGLVVTCSFTNLPSSGSSGSPACPTAPGNANGNTRRTTAELTLGPDLIPQPGSPAIEAGNPAGVAAGESATDRLGRPRAGASADVCDAGPGRRDQGAFERYRPSPSVTIGGPPSVAAGQTETWTVATNARQPEISWSVGGSGASVQHAFGAPGPASIGVQVRDAAWDCSAGASLPVAVTTLPASSPPPPAASADRTRPRVTKARLSARTVRLPRGSVRLRLELSEAATLTVQVGRRKGARLVAPRTVRVRAQRGAVTVTLFAQRLKLRRGAYGVRVSARDAAGNVSAPVALKLSAR